jgi:hypothetical protein
MGLHRNHGELLQTGHIDHDTAQEKRSAELKRGYEDAKTTNWCDEAKRLRSQAEAILVAGIL